MHITDTQQKELEQLVKPLQEWLHKNCHPHVTAIVDSENMELMEGVTTVQRIDCQDPKYAYKVIADNLFNTSQPYS